MIGAGTMAGVRSALRGAVNRAMARAGLKIVDINSPIGPLGTVGSEPLDMLSYLVGELAAAQTERRLRILQIGANDGEDEDPVAPFLATLEVEAARVEPLPELAEMLRARHAAEPHIHVVEAAVADHDGTMPIYVLLGEAGNAISLKMSSLDRQVLVRRIQGHAAANRAIYGANPRIEAREVETLRLATLLQRLGWDRLDVLVMDTEGFDLRIVSQLLDDGITISVLQFEYIHVPRTAFEPLLGRLTAAGYVWALSGYDLIAVHSDAGIRATGRIAEDGAVGHATGVGADAEAGQQACLQAGQASGRASGQGSGQSMGSVGRHAAPHAGQGAPDRAGSASG
ncbi:MAG: FkbM family methyltransferase [Pseudomonadota bacterium]